MIKTTIAHVFVAIFLTVTIGVNVPALNYEASSTLLLGPLVMWAFLSERSLDRLLYLIALIGGISSCLIAGYIAPDGQLVRHFFGLALMMIAPAFYFLGCRIADHRQMITVLGITAAACALVVVAPLLINGESVRSFRPSDTKSILNVSFLGLPIFGSLGIISLAFLLCTQLGLTIATAFVAPKRWMQAYAMLGAFALSYLVIGSESRSAQALVFFYIVLLGISIFWKTQWTPSNTSVTAGLLAIVMLSAIFLNLSGKTVVNSRLLQTIARYTMHESRISNIKRLEDEIMSNVRNTPVLTGRSELWSGAFYEFLSSPVYGNGFASYGRFTGGPKNEAEAENTSSHIYYLTILWKGGLLFGVPFLIFLFRIANPIFFNLRSSDATIFFGSLAALVGLTWMSVWWDTPNVPAVGCLIFFLVGVLRQETQRPQA